MNLASGQDAQPKLNGGRLQHPLYHPVSGQILLAAGTVLTDVYVAKIMRLGLVQEAIASISGIVPAPKAPRKPPRETPPAPPEPSPLEARIQTIKAIQSHAYALEERVSKALSSLGGSEEGPHETAIPGAIEQIFTPNADGDVAVGSAMALVEAIIRRIQAMGLAGLPDIRVYGGGESTHPINVFLLSTTLGIAMNLTREGLISLGQAALLHDAGKMRLNRKLLYKESPLTANEKRIFERHVEFGLDMLKNFHESFPLLNQDVYAGIRCHHERWDGQGYPQGLKEAQIPLIARIIAVADAYESMTADHPNQRRMNPAEAYRTILAGAGSAYDPLIVSVFRKVLTPYPPQSLVLLDNGQIAQVLKPGETLETPLVQLGFGEGSLDLSLPGAPRIVRQIFPRRHPRVPLELPAALKDMQEGLLIPGQLVNLSLGGAGLKLTKTLPVGTPVSLCLASDDLEILALEGLVAWRAPVSSGLTPLGIRFWPLEAHLREAVERLIGQPRSWTWQRK